MELLRISKDKRCLKFCKKRVCKAFFLAVFTGHIYTTYIFLDGSLAKSCLKLNQIQRELWRGKFHGRFVSILLFKHSYEIFISVGCTPERKEEEGRNANNSSTNEKGSGHRSN